MVRRSSDPGHVPESSGPPATMISAAPSELTVHGQLPMPHSNHGQPRGPFVVPALKPCPRPMTFDSPGPAMGIGLPASGAECSLSPPAERTNDPSRASDPEMLSPSRYKAFGRKCSRRTARSGSRPFPTSSPPGPDACAPMGARTAGESPSASSPGLPPPTPIERAARVRESAPVGHERISVDRGGGHSSPGPTGTQVLGSPGNPTEVGFPEARYCTSDSMTLLTRPG